jgi:hypothetical protein
MGLSVYLSVSVSPAPKTANGTEQMPLPYSPLSGLLPTSGNGKGVPHPPRGCSLLRHPQPQLTLMPGLSCPFQVSPYQRYG